MTLTLNEIEAEIALHLSKQQQLLISKPLFTQESWYYNGSSAQIIAGAFFTTELTIILSLINKETDCGKIHFIKGAFDSNKIMHSICELTFHLFPNTNFRQKRRVLMDYGRMLITLINQVDPVFYTEHHSNKIGVHTQIHSYMQYEDVDWIEDLMQEYISQNGSASQH